MSNPSYNYCAICGHTPASSKESPNYVHRFWDCDDGWKIGALCQHCWLDVEHEQPKPDDYAYANTNGVADAVETDEDPLESIPFELGGSAQ